MPLNDLCLPEAVRRERRSEWLGGCLQIPRETILYLVRRGYDNPAIAEQFEASEDMARFRRNMTGVDRQIARGANLFMDNRYVRSK
jgi:hypothetical protein